MTYIVLSVSVLAVIALASWRPLRTSLAEAGGSVGPLLVTGFVLIALTAVFDNVIVGVGLVDYDESKILGLRVPIAPIEDFSYTLGAVMIVPGLWTILGSGTWASRRIGQAASSATEETGS